MQLGVGAPLAQLSFRAEKQARVPEPEGAPARALKILKEQSQEWEP